MEPAPNNAFLSGRSKMDNSMDSQSQKSMKFNVVLEAAKEGGFVATCVEVPSAISQGETEQEALDNVADAIQSILELRRIDARRAAALGHLRTVEVNA